jgi:hypothetical protein
LQQENPPALPILITQAVPGWGKFAAMDAIPTVKSSKVALAGDKLDADNDHGPHGPIVALSVAALGVVYGDIGTSPLYALKQCFHGVHGIAHNAENVLGVLSLIVWSLILVVSIKYLLFVLKADNKGEGGIIALVALLNPWRAAPGSLRRTLMLAGLFGAALLYGDATITPAISVLSAVEGLQIAAPAFEAYVVPIAIAILLLLFAVQKHGTRRSLSTSGASSTSICSPSVARATTATSIFRRSALRSAMLSPFKAGRRNCPRP